MRTALIYKLQLFSQSGIYFSQTGILFFWYARCNNCRIYLLQDLTAQAQGELVKFQSRTLYWTRLFFQEMNMTILENQTELQPGNSSAYLNKISKLEMGIVVALYVLLLLAILTGNGLVLSAFSVNKRLRTAINTLIMGLAVSDILVGFVSIPCWLYIFTSFHKQSFVSPTSYQFYITFDIFIGGASILQLTALSMERCHAIVRPLRHRTLSMKVFYVMIAIPWLYAATVAGLQPVQYHRWQEVYTLLVATTCFFIPFVVIFIAYLFIYRFARSQPGRGNISKHRSVRKAYKKDLRLSVTIAVITGLFVVAWLPLFVLTMIGTYYPQYLTPSPWMDRVLQLVKFCHYSNSALNPIVYAFRNSEMIATFRHIGHRLLCKMRQEPLARYRSSSLNRTSTRRSFSLQSSLKKSSSLKGGSTKEHNADKEEIGRNNNRTKKGNTVVYFSTV